MRHLHRALGLALLASGAAADDLEIKVGSTPLSIPAPEGFKLLTAEMQPYADIASRFVPAQNRQHAVFLSPEDVELAAKGGAPEPRRFFHVQTLRDLEYRTVTGAEFADARQEMRTANARIARDIEEQVPGLMREINEGLTADYDVDLALSIGGIVPLPPHDESDRTFAFSLITKYEMTDLDGNPVRWEASATSTVVHLRAKVVFLYAVGPKEDLEWTRDVSRKWATAVIAANPSTGVFAEQERRRGFDWLRVVKYGVIGAVVAGLLSAFAARRKARGNGAGPA